MNRYKSHHNVLGLFYKWTFSPSSTYTGKPQEFAIDTNQTLWVSNRYKTTNERANLTRWNNIAPQGKRWWSMKTLRRALLFSSSFLYEQCYTVQNLPGKHQRFSGFLEIKPLGRPPQTCSTTPVAMIVVCLRLSCYFCYWSA